MGRVAIIGAGISGLSCANVLRKIGHTVTVFDKGRGLGGRIATRRAGNLRFDHGAQYATARTEEFADYLSTGVEAGLIASWATVPAPPRPRYVGAPGMSGLVKPLAEGLDVRLMSKVSRIERKDDVWRLLVDAKGYVGVFDTVVVAIPPVQAKSLLEEHDNVFAALDDVIVAPCWSAMFAFSEPLPIEEDMLNGEEAIAWAARNSTKPARDEAVETWVVHASPQWTRDHLERDRDLMAEPLLTAFYSFAGIKPVVPKFAAAHRWLYAMTEKPLGAPFLLSKDKTLAACGDWCLGAKIEAGFQSGSALGIELSHSLDPAPPVLPAVGSFG